MIYLFTGNSDFLVADAVAKWKNQFISKYGDFNLLHIKDFSAIDTNFLAENLLGTSFLSEKKLVILDVKSELKEDLVEFFLNSFSRIPEDNIILFNYPSPDKRQKFYKELDKISDKKEFNTNDQDIFSVVQNRYQKQISYTALNLLVKYKGNNLTKVVAEIDKLLITIPQIEDKDIRENIFPEIEESIFQIIDDILGLKILEAISKIKNITTEVNIYAFYNNLLANLRTQVFIMKLKNNGLAPAQITKVLSLGNKAFIVNKSYKITYPKLEKLYINLIDIDKKMKTGKMIGSEDDVFLYEIETTLFKTLTQ